jgi:autotransporter-associated beta strand protein
MNNLMRFVLAFVLLAGMLNMNTAHAQSGTWINAAGGSWANSANWQGGVIAQGTDSTADFSTLSLSADATVTLDGAQTVGNLIFGDQADAHNWFLDTGTGGPLTFSVSVNPTPTITVNNQTATIGLALAGTQGLSQNGNGTLMLVQSVEYDGGTTNNAGILELLGSLDTSNNPSFDSPLVINSGIVQSAATLNLDVNQNNDAGSTNVFGAGTLRLVATNNSSTSPDLFFGPDSVANDYFGAAIAVRTLDLGASQRYIFAITEHNCVAVWDPWEDARIDGNIVGAGGITYIAQNTYGGSEPMECPLVLAGADTFTGEVEIQRGSIYLFNANALVQTNSLLMDPATGNNARLFLYGNGATVANLESSGAGNALIANGNVDNPRAIAPATLTVNQSSNTVFGGVLVDSQYEYDNNADSDNSSPSGPLSLAINGPGTLTLSGANTYSGSTTINGGGLVISTLATGGGSFTLADGAALSINADITNTLAMSELTLGNSNTLEFDFTGTPSASVPPVTVDTLTANGGTNSVTINIDVNGGIPAGQFPLIQSTDGIIGSAGFSAFHLGTLPNGVAARLVNTPNSIDLLSLPVTNGGTDVSGTIVNQTWTSNNSPYIVTGDIDVAGLTILPGVTVQFSSNYAFEVEGVLQARGTPNAPIIFMGSYAGWQGIYFYYSSPGSVLACCVISNSVNSGIVIVNSNPTIIGCSIVSNSSVYGAGINANIASGNLIITDSIIANNSANIDPDFNPYNYSVGGGVYAVMETNNCLEMTGCTVTNNAANANYGYGWSSGAGLYVEGNATLNWCVMSGNSCFGRTEYNVTGGNARGGGLFAAGGQIALNNCILKNNSATSPNTGTGAEEAYGGAIYIDSGSVDMTNCIVQGNSAGAPNGTYGGGICIGGGTDGGGGTLNMVNCTIAYNNIEGLAIGGGSSANLLNSIVYFNDGGTTQITGDPGAATVNYSDVQNGFTGSNNINFNPVFLSTNDLVIVPGSRCVDAGDTNAAYNDVCFPPSLGSSLNDMGAQGGPRAGAIFQIETWPQIELLLFGGVPSYTYLIQASTDLLNWQTVEQFQIAQLGDVVTYFEPTTNNLSRRFYRLNLGP